MMFNLIHDIAPCSQGAMCRNSIENTHDHKCGVCRLAPENEDYDEQYWSGIKGTKHLVLEREKHERNLQISRDKILARQGKDKKRKKLLVKATKAEATTEQAIIKSTVNSGRKFKDGDHNLAECITLDTKMQSNRLHPKVDLGELAKVASDARRVGNILGALVIRNSNDVGVVVMKEEDFAVLIKMWSEHVSKK